MNSTFRLFRIRRQRHRAFGLWFLLLLLFPSITWAQAPEEGAIERSNFAPQEFVILAGLIQPILLGGGNVAVDLMSKRFVVGYSHGFLLRFEGDSVVGEASEQNLSYLMPFTTGGSLGYRIFDWLDVRAELKWHRFIVQDDASTGGSGDELFRYDTFTAGIGAYAHWRPFNSREDWLRGLNLSGIVRFWPNVASTLTDDRLEYQNPRSGERVIHEASNAGIANTPFIVNFNIGYSFSL